MQLHRHTYPEKNSLPLDSGHAPGNFQNNPKTQTVSSLYFHPHTQYLSAIDKVEYHSIIWNTHHQTQIGCHNLRPKKNDLKINFQVKCHVIVSTCHVGLGFRVLWGREVLVAKWKGKKLQTSLGFRVLQGGEVLVAKQKGKKVTNKFRV